MKDNGQKKKLRKQQKRRREQRRQQFPRTIQLRGKRYKVRKPRLEELMPELERRVLSVRRSPLEIAKQHLGDLTPEQQAILLEKALHLESSVPDYVNEFTVAQFLDTRPGVAFVLWFLLREDHPEMTEEDVERLVLETSSDEFENLLREREKLQLIPDDLSPEWSELEGAPE